MQAELDEKDIRAALTAIGEKDAQIQYQKDDNTETLRVTTSSGSAQTRSRLLLEKFPQAQFTSWSRQEVGATLGKEIQQSAIIASLLAMFGILVYVAFRYEFSFAVAAVIAVLHDVLFAIGAYCIANAISGRQFNATVVAAVLTIIGFSINDKIVIFDRIREDLKLGVRGSFKEIINHGAQPDLEPHDHHQRHGVHRHAVACSSAAAASSTTSRSPSSSASSSAPTRPSTSPA